MRVLALTGVITAVMLISGCGSDKRVADQGAKKDRPVSSKDVPAPQLLTDAIGSIAGTCIAVKHLTPGESLDYRKRTDLRTKLRFLIAVSTVDAEAPTADKGYTVRDGLYDLVSIVHGCDGALEAELRNTVNDL